MVLVVFVVVMVANEHPRNGSTNWCISKLFAHLWSQLHLKVQHPLPRHHHGGPPLQQLGRPPVTSEAPGPPQKVHPSVRELQTIDDQPEQSATAVVSCGYWACVDCWVGFMGVSCVDEMVFGNGWQVKVYNWVVNYELVHYRWNGEVPASMNHPKI